MSALAVTVIILAAIGNADCESQNAYQQLPASNYGAASLFHPARLMSKILSPIQSTLNHASNFLNNRLESAYDQIDAVQRQSFEMFIHMYNKSYSPQELPHRLALFAERRKIIQDSINAFRQGQSTFMMRENPYLDQDEEELKALTGVSLPAFNDLLPEEQQNLLADNPLYQRQAAQQSPLGAPVSRRRRSISDASNMTDNAIADDSKMSVKAESIPARWDWRSSGCVSSVIDQKRCGACYAIATMTAVESMRCLKQAQAPVLAPQQIVDCATAGRGYQNFGCDGGWPTRALQYLQDSGVAARESCYPFVRRQDRCKMSYVKQRSGCTVSSSPSNTKLRYKVLNNERDILYHVAKTGPVVTVMKATDKFIYYGSGIFDDPRCSRRRNDVDHAIVIVGYGRENGQDYWLIKNSWNTDWGINGYGKYKRGTNACSIGHWGWVLTS